MNLLRLCVIFLHDTYMLCRTILGIIEKDEVASAGIIEGRAFPHFIRLKLCYPALTVRFRREFVRIRIVETEAYEHRAPVAIGITVPGAISAITLFRFVAIFTFYDSVISFALNVTKLTICDSNNVFCPVACERHILQSLFPLGCCFQIGVLIRIADQCVSMLRFPTYKHLLIALLCVGMQLFFQSFAG